MPRRYALFLSIALWLGDGLLHASERGHGQLLGAAPSSWSRSPDPPAPVEDLLLAERPTADLDAQDREPDAIGASGASDALDAIDALDAEREALACDALREPIEVLPDPSPTPSLAWPLRGTLTSRYGRRRGRLHAGLDIAAPRGTVIVAAADGRVLRAGRGWGRYGKLVLLDHGGGYSTLYAHASRVFVKQGAWVRQGTAIAAVGRSGNATGNHLHFELWDSSGAIDPMSHLQDGRESVQLAGAR